VKTLKGRDAMSNQIKKKFIKEKAIDGSKILLNQNEALKQLSGDSEIQVVKYDGSVGKVILANGVAATEDYVSDALSVEAATREAVDAELYSDVEREILGRIEGDKALQDAIDAETSAREAAVGRLEIAIVDERARIDSILELSDSDYDSFKEIVDLINSVDTENDQAFAGYVLSNDAALEQEIADREAGDAQTLQDANAYTDAQIAAIPAVDLSAVESDISALQAADSALQAAVDAEASAREAADSALQAAVDAEASAREAADSALQAAVDAEASAREAADSALQAAVDAEASAREAGDAQALQDAKDYTDAQIAAIPAVDLSAVEADIAALQSADSALQAAIDDLDLYAQDIRDDVDSLESKVTTLENEMDAVELSVSNLSSELDAEASAREAADSALQAAVDAEASAREAGDAQALQDAKDYTDAQIAAIPAVDLSAVEADIAALQAADSALQAAIDAEKTRVDAILDASEADKDSFAEIVQLINSIDTENDQAFAGYVLSNDAALAQEVLDRQAGDAQALQDAKDYTDAQIAAIPAVDLSAVEADIAALQSADSALQAAIDAEASARETADSALQAAIDAEASAREAADSALQAAVDALEAAAPTFNKMKITMQAGQLAYVDLAHEAIENSIVVSVGRVMIHATDDYTVSVEDGVTRLTFVGSLVSPTGDEAIEVGDNVYVTYAYKA
jgi:hypothetical protein